MTDSQNLPAPLKEAPPPAITTGSAYVAFVLGLCTLPLSILAGIPAIIVGHRSLARIRKSSTRYNGVTLAKIGIVLGWLSVVWAVLVVATLGGISLLVPKVGESLATGRQEAARDMSLRLEEAIGEFYRTYEDFPYPKEGLAGHRLLTRGPIMAILMGEETGVSTYTKVNSRDIVFFEAKRARPHISLKGFSNGITRNSMTITPTITLWDPWGKPYRIRMGAADTYGDSIIIWSAGPDGIDGTPDDVKS